MITASAVTNEAGGMCTSRDLYGKSLTLGQVCTKDVGRDYKWAFSAKRTLSFIRNQSAGYLSVVAAHLTFNEGYSSKLSANIYHDKENGLYAIHCPSEQTVTFTTKSRRYKTTHDYNFIQSAGVRLHQNDKIV
jgi:hypothetical protein